MVGSEVLGQLQLGVVDVDGHGGGAEDLGVLQAEVRRPPMPTTMAVSPGRGWATLRALYVVTPAYVSGAASKEVTRLGTRTTREALPTAYSVYEPSIV